MPVPVSPAVPAIDVGGLFCSNPLYNVTACKPAEAANAAQTALDVMKDPFGSFVGALHAAASGLTQDVVPALLKVVQPDLTQDWWLTAYRLSFGLAILVFVMLVMWNLAQTSRGKLSGDQFVNSITFYAVMFFFGATFGPAIGTMLVKAFGALAENVVSADGFGMQASVGGVVDRLQATVDGAGLGMMIDGDLQKITGGSFVAAMLLFLMIVALILVFVVLLVQVVTLYLSGTLLPLSLVWIVNPSTRSKGLKLVALWIGLLSAQVLIFFLLSVAFNMTAGLGTVFAGKPGLQILVDMAVAIVALFMATLAPFGLLAFGKAVLPTSSPSPTHKGSMPSIGDHSASDGGGGSQLSSLSKQQAAEASSDAGGSAGGGAAGGAAPQPAMAGLASGGAGSAASAGGADGGAGGGSGVGGGSVGGGSGGAGAGGGSLGASGGGMAGAGAGAAGGGAAGGGGALAGAGAGGGAAGGGTMAAAAAAGGATAATGGAAAALAAPLILGKMAYDKGSDLAGKAADTAVEHMDYGMEDMTRRDGD